ncbi:alpha/beta fold hydrolase [Corynebacterium liangguodongii]|uniref:alpha/beta fold hydrolase n=1 Tax=Corynebacterium liangguodongii TaxID=2079535 RepID=UPI001F1BD338|nr:alpha/beta hydrolase [Corynebacterium liangguodongii]
MSAGAPSDPLIMLLHGTFGGWFDFRDVIAPLAARGFHVAAIDMRGYGMSDKPRPRPGNDMLVAVGDVKGAVAALGHKDATVLGADTGGAVAWVAAETYPEVVSKIVTVSAAHPAELRAAALARPWECGPTIGRIAVSHLPPAVLEPFEAARRRAYRRDLRANTAPPFQRSECFSRTLELRCTAASIDNAFSHSVVNSRLLTDAPSPRGAKITAPVLAIRPEQSMWARIDASQRARTTSSYAQVSIPTAKNLPHVEDPAAFVDVVAAFAARS